MYRIGLQIKQRIRKEFDWMRVSIGFGPNRFLAKMASNLKKPDGLNEISANNILDVLSKMSLEDIKGVSEATTEKTRVVFPMNEARAVVFLHKNHREYYSTHKQYQPFILPVGQTSRAAVKQWFLETYQLRLSVRPPHQKTWDGSKPVVLVNAQILSGEYAFRVFSKKQVAEYTKSTF
jgi:hypothetical protein